jgi:hypothetical protein
MLHPETSLQIAVMEWLSWVHPLIYAVTFASAGGLVTTPMSAKLLPQMGYKAGTPDLFLAYPHKHYHGLFLELKTERGKASIAQIEIRDRLRQQGYCAEIVQGFDETVRVIETYLKK